MHRMHRYLFVIFSDSQPYLPAVCQSINFTFSKNDGDMQSLQSYESVMVQGKLKILKKTPSRTENTFKRKNMGHTLKFSCLTLSHLERPKLY